MTIDRPTDAEILVSFLHVFTLPLARAIVAEMKAQGYPPPSATGASEAAHVAAVNEQLIVDDASRHRIQVELDQTKQELAKSRSALESSVQKIRELHLELSRLRARQAVEVDLEPDDEDDGIAAAFDAAHDFEDAEVPLSVKPKKTCRTCLRWLKGRCRSKSGPHANTTTGAGCTCDYHVERPVRLPAKPVDGRRLSRGLCPVCRRECPVTGQGIYPHDIHGVEYRAGRGDREHVCLGSRQPPLPAQETTL